MDIRLQVLQFDPIRTFTSGGNTQKTSALGQLGATDSVEGASDIGAFLGDGTDKLKAAMMAKQRAYSTELSELGQMHNLIASLGEQAQSLQKLSSETSDTEITSALRDFVKQYNQWDTRFDSDVANGGILQESQPAKMARFSLMRDVNSIFNGVGNGGVGQGMSELGIEVNKVGQIDFDEKKLAMALQSDRTGTLKTIHNMAANFADTAKMLDSDGKPLANRIGRLQDALAWIDTNMPELSSQTKQAISAYNTSAAL